MAINFGATYDPNRTPLKQAVARTGLTLKRAGGARSYYAVLLNEDVVVWEGPEWEIFDTLRAYASLKQGAH